MKKNATPVSAEPVILDEGMNSASLRFVKIQLRNRIITVTEPIYGIERRRARIVMEIMNDATIEEGPEKDTLLVEYSAVAALSTGNVPTAKEMMQMADADVRFWIKAGRRMAPPLFDWMEEIPDTSTPAGRKVVTEKKRRR
jgi:hypothetical protein